MRRDLYHGMLEDLRARDKTLQSELDVQAMQCRWVKLAIHGELEILQDDCAARGCELAVELEGEGGLVEGVVCSSKLLTVKTV